MSGRERRIEEGEDRKEAYRARSDSGDSMYVVNKFRSRINICCSEEFYLRDVYATVLKMHYALRAATSGVVSYKKGHQKRSRAEN